MKPVDRAGVLRYLSGRPEVNVQEVTTANPTEVPDAAAGDVIWWFSGEKDVVMLLRAEPMRVAANEEPQGTALTIRMGGRSQSTGTWSWSEPGDARIDDRGVVWMCRGTGILGIVPVSWVDKD